MIGAAGAVTAISAVVCGLIICWGCVPHGKG